MLDASGSGNHLVVISTKERNELITAFEDMFCKADETTPKQAYSLGQITREFPVISELYALIGSL